MPNCFKLISKETNEAVSLINIDELICEKVLNIPIDPVHWGGGVFNWHDTIGFQLAMGKTLENGENSVSNYYWTNDIWEDELQYIMPIIKYLQNNYTARSWYEVNR
jgi:hypothetical protein